jgi:hypothetical protein
VRAAMSSTVFNSKHKTAAERSTEPSSSGQSEIDQLSQVSNDSSLRVSHNGRELGLTDDVDRPGGHSDQLGKFIGEEYLRALAEHNAKESGGTSLTATSISFPPSADSIALAGIAPEIKGSGTDARSISYKVNSDNSWLGSPVRLQDYLSIPVERTPETESGLKGSGRPAGYQATVATFFANPEIVTHKDQETGKMVRAGHFIHPEETDPDRIVAGELLYPKRALDLTQGGLVDAFGRHIKSGSTDYSVLNDELALRSRIMEPEEKRDEHGKIKGWVPLDPNHPNDTLRRPVPFGMMLDTVMRNITSSPGLRPKITGDDDQDEYNQQLWELGQSTRFGADMSPANLLIARGDTHHLFQDQQHKIRALLSDDRLLSSVVRKVHMPDRSADGSIDFTKYAPIARLGTGMHGWNTGINQAVLEHLQGERRKMVDSRTIRGDIIPSLDFESITPELQHQLTLLKNGRAERLDEIAPETINRYKTSYLPGR